MHQHVRFTRADSCWSDDVMCELVCVCTAVPQSAKNNCRALLNLRQAKRAQHASAAASISHIIQLGCSAACRTVAGVVCRHRLQCLCKSRMLFWPRPVHRNVSHAPCGFCRTHILHARGFPCRLQVPSSRAHCLRQRRCHPLQIRRSALQRMQRTSCMRHDTPFPRRFRARRRVFRKRCRLSACRARCRHLATASRRRCKKGRQHVQA